MTLSKGVESVDGFNMLSSYKNVYHLTYFRASGHHYAVFVMFATLVL